MAGPVRRWYANLLALAVVVALPSPVLAEDGPPPPAVSAETLIEAARTALSRGKLDDAEFLLGGVKPGEGDADDLDFLRGTIALGQGDWQTAIARFRAMLARDPTLLRVRLDLAFAYFQAREDKQGAYHFRLVLGEDDLPPAVQANALAFLDRIRRRKSWSVSGALAIAPDSNINAATSAREIALFDLPATLSEDARETSGVGLTADIAGSHEIHLSPDTRFSTHAGLYTRTYEDSRYNDRTLSLRAGPRFLFEKFDLRPEASALLRQLGGDTYSRAFGLGLSGNWRLAPAWRLNAGVSAERISYESFLGDGNIYGARLGLSHAFGRSTLLRADTSYRREALTSEAHSWRELSVGFLVARELPRGFVVSAGPSYRWRRYDRPVPIFGSRGTE